MSTERPIPARDATMGYMQPLEGRERELTFLTEIAQALAAPEGDGALLTLILERLAALLGCECVALLQLSANGREYELVAVLPKEPERLAQRHYPRPDRLIETAIAERRAVQIAGGGAPNESALARWLLKDRPLRFGVAVPLGARAESAVGALVALNGARPLDRADVHLLAVFADQAAAAMQRWMRPAVTIANSPAVDTASPREQTADVTASPPSSMTRSPGITASVLAQELRSRARNAMLEAITRGCEEDRLIRRTLAALRAAGRARHVELFVGSHGSDAPAGRRHSASGTIEEVTSTAETSGIPDAMSDDFIIEADDLELVIGAPERRSSEANRRDLNTEARGTDSTAAHDAGLERDPGDAREGADERSRRDWIHLRAARLGKPVIVRSEDGHARRRDVDPSEPAIVTVCVPFDGEASAAVSGTMLLEWTTEAASSPSGEPGNGRASGRLSNPSALVSDEAILDALGTIAAQLGRTVSWSRLTRRAILEADALERRLAECAELLTRTREQLVRSQWLASLGELAAGVAHDLNNALNPIVAFAELIREHGNEPERVKLYAERILMAAQGGAETVRRIHRFTRRRLGALPLETVRLAALVEEAVELTRPNWGERTRGGRVEIELGMDPELEVQGNPGELRQALLNLITNALDAMPGGGVLRFVTQTCDDEVLLAVQDTGAGMPLDIRDRAMEPFFTTKGVRGTGLGLSEVFGIARRHGGTLDLESWDGMGTTVTLRLPAPRGEPSEPVRRRRSEAPSRSHRILLVDDNVLSLEATAASLRTAGHTVATASRAEDAMRIFGSGRYDLVLTDLGLPDMSGWDLIEQLRGAKAETRFGVITGWSLPESDDELARRGIELVFIKPVDPDDLLASL